MSVLDFVNIGSTLSLRSFSRFGSAMSIFATVALGNNLQFTTADAAIFGRESSGAYTKRISFPDGTSYEGILHGTWLADEAIGTSDRRLKTNIAPLHRTLLSYMSRATGATDDGPTSISDSSAESAPSGDARSKKKSRRDAVDWVLRELRPVSFSFRQGLDSKSMHGRQRYGFVAQEVERVAPDLVQDHGTHKTMLYQDLIAMITMAAKDHQDRLEQHNGEVGKLRGLLKKLGEKLSHLQKRVSRVIGPFEPRSYINAKTGSPTPTSV